MRPKFRNEKNHKAFYEFLRSGKYIFHEAGKVLFSKLHEKKLQKENATYDRTTCVCGDKLR